MVCCVLALAATVVVVVVLLLLLQLLVVAVTTVVVVVAVQVPRVPAACCRQRLRRAQFFCSQISAGARVPSLPAPVLQTAPSASAKRTSRPPTPYIIHPLLASGAHRAPLTGNHLPMLAPLFSIKSCVRFAMLPTSLSAYG